MKSQERGLRIIRRLALAGTAIVTLAPMAASAAPSRQAELEARLKMLEQAVTELKSELEQARTQQVQQAAAQQEASAAATAKTDAIETRVAAVESRPSPEAPAPQQGFVSGKTTFKIGGFIRTVGMVSHFDSGEVAGSSVGRDFYVPGVTPVGNGKGATYTDAHAKQTRFWFDMNTNVAGHTLKGHIETDFQTSTGDDRVTNGYDLRLRRAFVQYDNLTVGQDWTTFQYLGALPESADFLGPSEGTVFVRQALVRYSMPLSKNATLHLAVENPETESASVTATGGSPALTLHDTSHVPDIVARLNYKAPFGEFSVAGIGRQLRASSGSFSDTTGSWGVSVGGNIPVPVMTHSDFRFMATYGSGLGRYVAVNFAPGAISDTSTGTLRAVKLFSAMASVKLGWTESLRSTFMAGYMHVDYPDVLTMAQIGTFNKESWSLGGNLFWSPVKDVDFGVEYRRAHREIENGATGNLDRWYVAAKYSF